jgi:hypothetical protein
MARDELVIARPRGTLSATIDRRPDRPREWFTSPVAPWSFETTDTAAAGGLRSLPFLLVRYPVTVDLHRAVTGTDLHPGASGATPVTNVRRLDAIDVCNQISARAGLTQAYSRDAQSGEVAATGRGRLPPTERGGMAVRLQGRYQRISVRGDRRYR